MTNTRRLEDKIARLAGPDIPIQEDGREVGGRDRRGRLLAFIQEIDETILPSELVFDNYAKDALVVEVANRRLLRLNGEDLPQTGDGEVLFPDLAQTIEDFLSETDTLKVTASRISRQIDPSEVGCSSTMIAKYWAIDPYRGAPESALDRLDIFMEACSVLSSAWMRLDAPGIIQKSGTEEDTQRLAAIIESDLSEVDRNLEQCTSDSSGSHCTILGTSSGDARSIAYVKAGTSLALVIFASEQLPQVHSLWQSIHR